MNIKIRFLALLPVILLLIACRTLFSPQFPMTTPVHVDRHLLEKSSSIEHSTTIPVPSSTSLPVTPSLVPSLVVTSPPVSSNISLQMQLGIFEELWSIVNDTYVYPDFNGLDWDAIHETYRKIIAAGLTDQEFYSHLSELINSLGDNHSYFLDPQQVLDQEAEFQGNHDYVGIGIMVTAVPERKRAVIISVLRGSPAENAGIQPRDSILSVDGIPILDESGYLRDIVRGPVGTTIDVSVQTPGELPRLIHLTRQRITGTYPLVHQVITTPEGKRMGYIFLVTFMDGTVDEEVIKALKEMTADAPLDGLILDNRMNGGGSSLVLEPMLGFFSGGNLGYFVNHSRLDPLRIKQNDINGSSSVPLVVLVGSGTASFGEIFAGVLQDVGRAYLIGTTTEGNVEILWGYDFDDGSQLWLANETFQPLNHPEQDWEKSGIIPDFSVTGEFDQYSMNNDPVVLAAIHYLSGQ
jgi:carboxyl-terminal processing protease